MSQAAAAARAPMSELAPLLGHLGRRLRLRDGWLVMQRSLWIACTGALLIQVAGRLWPVADLWRWTPLPFVIWLLLVVGSVLVRRTSPMRIARRVDLELGLKERLSTATALHSSTLPSFQQDLVAKQSQDALDVAQSIEPSRAFPLRWLWRPLALAGVLLAAMLLLALLPNPMDAVIAERAEVAQAVQEQAERVEELRDEIAATELPEEQREELLRRLAELVDRLRANPGDRESALADLSRLEEMLQRQVDPHADAKQAALDALAQQLESLAGQESAEAADPDTPADAGEMDETLQALAEQIALAGEAERQELAQRLGQMAARAAQAGNTSLAQALSDMAQAAQAGDADAASQAAGAAAEAMRQAQGELSAQAALRRSLSQVGQSRQAIAAAGSGAGQGQQGGQGQQVGSGQGSQGQSGQGQAGQGQGGQGQSGGGTKADQLPPGTGQGQAGRPEGEARPGGEDTLDQQVFVPWERRPGSGEEVTLPGQDSGQGESEVRERENPLPGSPDEALVPYYEVFYQYLDAANQAMERTYVPSGLQEYVREYFSRLEPE